MSDQLSNLPDDVLLGIISRLPIGSQAQTSLLSKRWRYLWCRSPVLDLSYDALQSSLWRALQLDGVQIARRCRSVTDDCLDRWQAPCLSKFQLDVLDCRSDATLRDSVERWLRRVAALSVQDLRLCHYDWGDRDRDSDSIYRLPPSLLECSSSLSSLHLMDCLPPVLPPDFQSFGALKTLHLEMDSITADDPGRLLLACPLLEDLKIKGNHMIGPILPPNFQGFSALKTLHLTMDSIAGSELGKLLLSCPLLEELKIKGNRKISPILLPNFQGFSALKTLHLTMDSIAGGELGKLLLSCPLLEELKISLIMNYPLLSYRTNHGETRHLTVSSPKLTTLELKNHARLVLEVIVDAPSLTALSIHEYVSVSFKNDAPHLLNFSFHDDIWNEGRINKQLLPHMLLMLPHICHVRILSIDIHFLELIIKEWETASGQPVAFGDLKELHLNVCWITDPQLRAIDIFLEKHTFLETFCLLHISRGIVDAGDYSESLFKQYHEFLSHVYETERGKHKLSFKNRQSYLLPRLKMLRVFGILGTRNEMRLMKFLLASATSLELLHLFCDETGPNDLLRKLSQFHQASPDVRLLLAEDDDWRDNASCTSPQRVHIKATGECDIVDCSCFWHPIDCPWFTSKRVVRLLNVEFRRL